MPALVLGGLCLLLAAFGEPARALLRYEREALAAGELWRALTAHLVHLNLTHALLNVAGLVLVAWLFQHDLGVLDWAAGGFCAAIAISVGLWVLEPQTAWYVGLSGVLHGWFALGAARVCEIQRGLGSTLLLALGCKLLYESLQGTIPFTTALDIGPVVVAAHLFGAAGALLCYVALRVRRLVGAVKPPL